MPALNALDGRVHFIKKQKFVPVFEIYFFQRKIDPFQPFQCVGVRFRGNQHPYNEGERRKRRGAAHGDLVFIKSFIVIRHGKTQDGVFGIVRLQHDFPFFLAPAAAARHLRDELKSALAAAIVGKMQAHVGIEDADEGNGRKVVSLGDHLRTDQNIRPAARKGLQDLEMSLFSARRIVVHAQNARGGIEFFEFLHDPFGARAVITQMLAAAFGAGGQHAITCAAIVAFETMFLMMIGQADVAGFAFGDIAAFGANDRTGITAAVQK